MSVGGCADGSTHRELEALGVVDVEGVSVEVATSADRGICSRVLDEDWVCQPLDHDQGQAMQWAQLKREPGAPLLLRVVAAADATIEGLDGAERVRVAEHDLVLAAVDSGPVCFRAGLPTATELGRIVVNEAALDNGSGVTMPAEVEPGTGTGCN